MAFNYYASSPAMVLAPNQEHSSFPFGNKYLHHCASASQVSIPQAQSQQNATMIDPSTSTSALHTVPGPLSASRKLIRPRFPRPPSLNYLAKTESLASGRKRSFADAAENIAEPEDDGSRVTSASAESFLEVRTESTYGPDVRLPYDSSAIAAEPQTGTWAEDATDHTGAELAELARRPTITSRKSRRRAAPDVQSTHRADSFSSTIDCFFQSGTPSPTVVDAPIDALTLALGVGWKRISPTLAPAAKGWEKYIANHYQDIIDPTILLHSEAHHAYLVQAISSSSDTQECWWVFQEDLSVCHLVGLREADAIRSLQRNEMIGPAIEASKEARRTSTSQSEVRMPCALQNAATTTRTAQHVPVLAANPHGDVEMEL